MYISIDGDNIGKQLEKFILIENLKGLNEFCSKITENITYLKDFILKNNGEVYLIGGDNIFASIPSQNIEIMIEEIKKLNLRLEIKFSTGYSENVKETYLALKYAKSLKNGTIVYAKKLNTNIEFEIK